MEFKQEWVTPTIVGALSFAAGTAVGYFLIPRKEASPVEEILRKVDELERKQANFDDEKENRDYSFNSLYLRATEHLEAITEQIAERDRAGLAELEEARRKHPTSREDQDEEVEKVNVFVVEDDWDYEEELKNRSSDAPYILHRDEYFSNEMELDQSTLEYYAGDNILCDEKDVPLYNFEKIVGKLEFGKGSHDPSIVYIRNETLGSEWEVLLNEGTFQAEILGEEIEEGEVKHSLLKFRSD